MATNEQPCGEISSEKCIPESCKLEEESDNTCPSGMVEKINMYNELLELEAIVTCSIHLGIMENPKKLCCQHSFCYNCLKDYLKTCNNFICPICRAKEKNPDIDNLPSALTENKLIDVVMKHRLCDYFNDSKTSSFLSDEQKEDLAKHLLNEIKSNNKTDVVMKTNVIEEADDSISTTLNLENIDNPNNDNSTYEALEIEASREYMRKHSRYVVVKRDTVQRFYKILCKNENIQLDFSIFDICFTEDQPQSIQLVFVDCTSNQLVVYSESSLRVFHINLESSIVKTDYIRIFKGNLLLSGRLEQSGRVSSVFLHCNMNGDILYQSILYPWLSSVDIPMMLGFDINEKERKYYLCMPNAGNVRIYNSTFVESPEYYDLNEYRPEYVAFYSLHNQLWISCPQNKRILILDISSGNFKLFNTERINNAIPKMIFITDDKKIVFLDTRGNRFIWIEQRNEYILTQKLHIPIINRNFPIKTFQVVPISMIILGIDNEILIFKSTNYVSTSRLIFELCSVL